MTLTALDRPPCRKTVMFTLPLPRHGVEGERKQSSRAKVQPAPNAQKPVSSHAIHRLNPPARRSSIRFQAQAVTRPLAPVPKLWWDP